MTFPRCLQLSGGADRHEQPLRGRCAENASSPETAAGPMQAGWRGRVGGTSRRPLLPHPASSTVPCGRVTAELRPAALPGVSPLIGAHAASPRRSQSPPARGSAPRPGQRLPKGATRCCLPVLSFPMTGGLSSLPRRDSSQGASASTLGTAPRPPGPRLPPASAPDPGEDGQGPVKSEGKNSPHPTGLKFKKLKNSGATVPGQW